MTPFGIRKKLKAAIFGEQKPKKAKAEKPRFDIVVVGPGTREQKASVPIGQTVLLSAGSLGAPIASGCSDSSCGTCRFEVLEGEDLLGPKTQIEIDTLAANKRAAHLRLGCQATVVHQGRGNLKVRAFEFLE